MSDEELFAQEMAGVKPLARDARVRLVKEALSEEQQTGRRLAAEGAETVSNPLVDEGVLPLDPWFILEFKRPGIQNGVYRKLRLGQFFDRCGLLSAGAGHDFSARVTPVCDGAAGGQHPTL